MRFGDLFLQCCSRGISVSILGDNEGQCNQLVRVIKSQKVVPVLLVELRQGSEDQNRLLVCYGIAGTGDVVHMVMHHWRRYPLAICLLILLSKG